MEELIRTINEEIKKCGEQTTLGQAPDFSKLDSTLYDFAEELKKIPAEEVKSYKELLLTWTSQMKTIQQEILKTKDDTANKIRQATANQNATNKYSGN